MSVRFMFLSACPLCGWFDVDARTECRRCGYVCDPSPLLQALDSSFRDEMEPEPHPAAQSTVDSMIGNLLVSTYEEPCGICLENIRGGDTYVEAPCCRAHSHPDCMEKALLVIPHCPYCRQIKSTNKD